MDHLAGQRVEDDIDAFAAGPPQDVFGEGGGPGVGHVSDAFAAQELSPLLASRSGVNLRAEPFRDAHRGQSDAASGRVDENTVPAAHAGEAHQREVRGDHREQRRGLRERQRRGLLDRTNGVERHMGGEQVAAVGEHLIAGPQVRHGLADADDGARALQPERLLRVAALDRLRREQSGLLEHVLEVEPDMGDLDLDLGRARRPASSRLETGVVPVGPARAKPYRGLVGPDVQVVQRRPLAGPLKPADVPAIGAQSHLVETVVRELGDQSVEQPVIDLGYGRVEIDEAAAQLRPLGADDPAETPQGGRGRIGRGVVGGNTLRARRDDEQRHRRDRQRLHKAQWLGDRRARGRAVDGGVVQVDHTAALRIARDGGGHSGRPAVLGRFRAHDLAAQLVQSSFEIDRGDRRADEDPGALDVAGALQWFRLPHVLVPEVRRATRGRAAVLGQPLGAQTRHLRDHLAVIGDEGQVAFEPSGHFAAPVSPVHPQPLAGRAEEPECLDARGHIRAGPVATDQYGTGDHGLQSAVEDGRVQAIPVQLDRVEAELAEDLAGLLPAPQPFDGAECRAVVQVASVQPRVHVVVAQLGQRPREFGQGLGAPLRYPRPGHVPAAELGVQRPGGFIGLRTAVQRHEPSRRVVTRPHRGDRGRREHERPVEDDILQVTRIVVGEHRQRDLKISGAREDHGLADPVVDEVRELGRGELDVPDRRYRGHGPPAQARPLGTQPLVPGFRRFDPVTLALPRVPGKVEVLARPRVHALPVGLGAGRVQRAE